MRITDKIKEILSFIGEVFEKFIDDIIPEFGAVISFYTSFSPALLLIMIEMTGLIF